MRSLGTYSLLTSESDFNLYLGDYTGMYNQSRGNQRRLLKVIYSNDRSLVPNTATAIGDRRILFHLNFRDVTTEMAADIHGARFAKM